MPSIIIASLRAAPRASPVLGEVPLSTNKPAPPSSSLARTLHDGEALPPPGFTLANVRHTNHVGQFAVEGRNRIYERAVLRLSHCRHQHDGTSVQRARLKRAVCLVVRGRVHGGEGAVIDFKRDADEKDERERDPRLPISYEKPPASQGGRISVDSHSLASQRRAMRLSACP